MVRGEGMRTLLACVTLAVTTVASAAAQDDWEPRRRSRGDGVHVRIAKDYYLPADQAVTNPVIVVAGDAIIDGAVEQEIVVVGGTVRIGPTARIRGDVTTVGG